MLPIENWITLIRREFHREPELSFKEFKTQQMIMDILHELGIEPEKIADTGVIATINGSAPSPCIALRSDMDALEVLEEPTEFNRDYISRNRGIMHACGHDGHIAMVLGAARLLQENREKLTGSVRLIFQPAEEQPPGGAERVINDGGLDGVDAIVGMHIFGDISAGKVAFKPGRFMASSNMFSVKIIGKGGHHSKPGDCINPILIASEFISTVDKEVRNRIDTAKYVLGIGKIEGGAQFNRTPDEVNLLGSYRTFDGDDTRTIDGIMKNNLESLMKRYAKGGYNGVPAYELDILHGYPVLMNDRKFTKAVSSLLKKKFADVDGNAKPIFGAEDFAFYLQKVPGIYMSLGTENIKKGIVERNHSNKFDIDEDILITGTNILQAIVMDFLENTGEYIP